MSSENHYRIQLEELANFLQDEEKNRIRPGESAVECSIRLIRTRRPKIRARPKLRLWGFSKLITGMQRLEQEHGDDLCLELLPDGSGRIVEWDSGKELFWFDMPEQLFRKLQMKPPKKEFFHEPDKPD